MKLSDFEKYKKLTPDDKEANWAAIDDLMPHLNDHLLVAEEYQFTQQSLCRMVGFHAKNSEKTQLYALASNEGKIIVGKADALSEHVELELAKFDPHCCEIINLAVSGQEFFFGEQLGLWVCVNRFSDSETTSNDVLETLIYHALIGVNEHGELQFKSAQDEHKQEGKLWLGQALKNVPVFLKTWNYSSAYQADPFLMPESVKSFLEVQLPAINCVNSINTKLCYTKAKKIVIVDTKPTSLAQQTLDTLNEQANCLALKQQIDGELTGIAGCDDRRVIGFSSQKDSETLRENWRQEQTNYPVAISFVENMSLTDVVVLIAYRSGYIRRMCRISPREIKKVWTTCWQNLCCVDSAQPEKMLGTINFLHQQIIGASITRREACLYKLLNCLQEFSTKSAEKPRQLWIDTIAERQKTRGALSGQQRLDYKESTENQYQSWIEQYKLERQSWIDAVVQKQLFVTKKIAGDLSESCMDFFISHLQDFAQDIYIFPQQGNEDNFFTQLLFHLYTTQLSLNDRQRLDRCLNTLVCYPNAKKDKSLLLLKQSAQSSVSTVWASKQPEQLGTLLTYAHVALEYWTNEFLTSNSKLFYESPDKQGLMGLLTTELERQPYLLALKAACIQLYRLSENARPEKVGTFVLNKGKEDCFTQIRAVYSKSKQQPNCFIVMQQSGNAFFIKINKSHTHYILQHEKPDELIHPAKNYYSWRMAICPAHTGGTLLAVAGSEGRRATLFLYHITDDESKVKLISKLSIQIPWISCLDISLSSNGYFIAAATDQASIARLYLFDHSQNTLTIKHSFNISPLGTYCLSFDSKHNPHYLTAGGCSGLLWCADIQAHDKGSAICWFYQAHGSIRCIKKIKIEDKPYFLIGTGKGELCLINIKQGYLLWKREFNKAIRHISINDAGLILAMRGGIVKVLEKTPPRAESLNKINRCLQALSEYTNEDLTSCLDWGYADSACTRALLEVYLHLSSGTLTSIELKKLLNASSGRETRHRLLTYLLRATYPISKEIVSALMLRELTLLLTQLPNITLDWIKLIWKQVIRNYPQEKYFTESQHDFQTAIVACLQALSRQDINLKTLSEGFIDAQIFQDFNWIHLEYARLILSNRSPTR